MDRAESSVLFSESTELLDAAMCSVWEKQFDAIKNTQGFNYKYPQLSQIVDLVKPALKDAGLCDFVIPTTIDGQPAVMYRVLHLESGQWMETSVPIGVAMSGKTPMQDLGGAITYMARYFRVNVWNVQVWDEDAAPAKPREEKDEGKEKILNLIRACGDVETVGLLFKQHRTAAVGGGWEKELISECAMKKETLTGGVE